MKKIIFSLLIILFQIQLNFCQNLKKGDSLISIYQNSLSDIEKSKTSNLIFQEFKHKKPETGIKYVKKGLKLALKNNYTKDKGIAYRNLGYYFRFKPNIDSSRYYFKKSYKILENNNQLKELIDTVEEFATFECMQGDYEKAIDIARKGFEYAVKIKSSQHMLICLNRMTTIYTDSGDFEAATDENLKAFKILDTSSSREIKTCKAITLRQKARIEMLRGNYQLTIKPLKEVLIIAKEVKNYTLVAVNYIEIGNAYWYIEEYDNALDSYNKSLKFSRKINRKDFTSIALSNIASLHTERGDYKKAIVILKNSFEIQKEIGSKMNLIVGYNLIADAYFNSGQYDQSIINYTKSIKLADSVSALDVKRDGYFGRSEVYRRIGNYKASLKDIKEYIKLNDSTFNLESSKQIEELKTIYETEKKEAAIALQKEEIKTLNTQSVNDKLTKTFYGTGMFSLLVIAGLLYFVFKQRIKKNKIEREKQEEIYKQEIEFKKKELASQTLHLVQKNTFIQELKENLEKIKKSPELFKIEFRRLVMLLKKESAEDKDWEVFKSYFSEVHNNFDHKLKAIYEDISEKEMRLASFLRMNLSTKEIASMLNVLPDSVLKSKYRLKKKLNLDKEMDLNNFLKNL